LNVFDVAGDNQTIYGDAYLGDVNGLTISGVIKSQDGGISWQLLDLGIDDINYLDKIEVNPVDKENVFAIVAIRGTISRNSLVRTADGGKNWSVVADTAVNVFINQADPNYVFHFYEKYFYISSDNGKTFSKNYIGFEFYDLVINTIRSGELYGITNSGFILKSTDYGYNWNKIEALQKDVGIIDLQMCYSNSGSPILFGSTWHNGILRYELNDPSAVEEGQFENVSYTLSQNFPNPFNPSTTIQFSIPIEAMHASSAHVTLKVYDVLGREVAILVNDEKPAGSYSVTFNVETLHGASLPSGVYFYKLTAGEYIQTKKMLLMK
jgi:hypothetical protein